MAVKMCCNFCFFCRLSLTHGCLFCLSVCLTDCCLCLSLTPSPLSRLSVSHSSGSAVTTPDLTGKPLDFSTPSRFSRNKPEVKVSLYLLPFWRYKGFNISACLLSSTTSAHRIDLWSVSFGTQISGGRHWFHVSRTFRSGFRPRWTSLHKLLANFPVLWLAILETNGTVLVCWWCLECSETVSVDCEVCLYLSGLQNENEIQIYSETNVSNLIHSKFGGYV